MVASTINYSSAQSDRDLPAGGAWPGCGPPAEPGADGREARLLRLLPKGLQRMVRESPIEAGRDKSVGAAK